MEKENKKDEEIDFKEFFEEDNSGVFGDIGKAFRKLFAMNFYKKIKKFEDIEKFRDLDSLKLINKDKSTEKLIDKFKDLQDIYIIIRTK